LPLEKTDGPKTKDAIVFATRSEVQGISHPPCFAVARNDPPELLLEKCPPMFCCVCNNIPTPQTSSTDASPIWYHGMLPWPYEATSCPQDGASEAMSNRDGGKRMERKRKEAGRIGRAGFPSRRGIPSRIPRAVFDRCGGARLRSRHEDGTPPCNGRR